MPDPSQDAETILPLPAGMRAKLLEILAIGYPAGFAQTRLGNAPDSAIAWQVQSMLDDYAEYEAGRTFGLNDDHYGASKAVGAI